MAEAGEPGLRPFVWRLYYEDGSTYDDTIGEPWQSPPWGVVAVTQPQEEMDKIIVGADYLMWRIDRQMWTQCGVSGLDDHLMHYGHLISCFRKGRWVPTLDVKAIWRRARLEAGIK